LLPKREKTVGMSLPFHIEASISADQRRQLGGTCFRYQAKIENGSERARRYTYKRAANIAASERNRTMMLKATAMKRRGGYVPAIYLKDDDWGRGYDQRRGHFCATPAEAVAFEEADLHKKFEKLAADYQALRERQAANEQVMTAAKEVMTAAKEKEQRLALEQEQLFAKARWLIGDDGLARMRQN
jgi:hypothetical protein